MFINNYSLGVIFVVDVYIMYVHLMMVLLLINLVFYEQKIYSSM